MEGIKVNKRPRLKSPYLICAWPGMGEVAFKAARYLADKLRAGEFAEIPAQDFFYLTSSIVEKGVLAAPQLPYSKFYFWKNRSGEHDLIIFISSAQPDLARAQGYAQRIINLAKDLKVHKVVTFASMPVAIEHTQQPGVWFTATDEGTNKELEKFNLNLLSEGQISGMNGLFLGLARKEGLPGFCLLGEIPLYTIQIENPKASGVLLEALGRILDLRLDLTDLAAQTQAMEEEINKLLGFLKGGSADNPIGDEDIEKIKKSLSQLTKLPLSIKAKIDNLFNLAQKDISQAGLLKEELDKWSVYKEYEDRFLDLFKKRTKNNNN